MLFTLEVGDVGNEKKKIQQQCVIKYYYPALCAKTNEIYAYHAIHINIAKDFSTYLAGSESNK